jgi:hypothetical protein
MYLIQDTPSNRRYIGKYIEVFQFPDGFIEIRAAGVSLPYSTYDKVGTMATSLTTVVWAKDFAPRTSFKLNVTIQSYAGPHSVAPNAAGVCIHLGPDDAVRASHRPHHVAIARGLPLREMAAELFGKRAGFSGGRGGRSYVQLQYSQVVILVFNKVRWPHVTVGTLTLSAG